MTIFHKHTRLFWMLGLCISALQSSAYALDVNANAKDVADKLNELYQHTQPCKNDEPAYYCSGIVIHGYEDEEASPWYLNAERPVGSFSYLRKDITPSTGEPIWVNKGYILTPIDDLDANNEFHYSVPCAYPGDGATFDGLETSCVYSRTNFFSEEIFSKDIHSAEDYAKKYLYTNNGGHVSLRPAMGIAFPATKKEFDLTLQIYQYIYKDHLDQVDKNLCNDEACRVHNELIVTAWNKDNAPAAQVPIMAFFATINDDQDPLFKSTGRTSSSAAEIKELFDNADAYAKATNYERRIPVITIDMAKLRKGEPDAFAPAVRPQ